MVSDDENDPDQYNGPSHVDPSQDEAPAARRRTLSKLTSRMTAQRDRRAAERDEPRGETVLPDQGADMPPAHHRQLARPFRTGFFAALGVVAAYVLFLAVDTTRQTLIVIAIAGVIAIGLEPGVQFFIRRGVKRGWAVVIVFSILLAALAGALVAILPPIITETIALVKSLPQVVEDLGDNPLIQDLDERFHILEQIQDSSALQDLGGDAAGGVLTAGIAAAGIALDLVIILILTLFFLVGYPKMKKSVYRLAPASRRQRVQTLGDRVLDQMGGYLSGMTVVALQAGIVAGVFAAIVGLPYPWAIGLGAMILDFVPIVGPVIIGVSMTLLGFTQSILIGIIAGAFYLAQHMFEAYWLYPRVMRRQVDISTASVVVAILLGSALLGVTGAVLAVPVAAAVQLIIREVIVPIQDRS